MTYPHTQKGFTLIEIIVSVGIFVVVMLIAVGAVLNAVDANRKAQNINVVVNNLNLAVESMVRDLRTGSDYLSCGQSTPNGGFSCVTFTDKDGNPNVMYNMVSNGAGGFSLEKSNSPNGSGIITGDEIMLTDVNFLFNGLANNDGPQRILLHLKGVAGSGKTKAEFNIETVITSRVLDISEFH